MNEPLITLRTFPALMTRDVLFPFITFVNCNSLCDHNVLPVYCLLTSFPFCLPIILQGLPFLPRSLVPSKNHFPLMASTFLNMSMFTALLPLQRSISLEYLKSFRLYFSSSVSSLKSLLISSSRHVTRNSIRVTVYP